MRTLMIALALGLAPAAAHAQGAAGAAAAAALNLDTPIETILADPAGKAVLQKDMAEMLAHPAFDMLKAMSLRQVKDMSGGAISDEMLTKVETDLKAAKPASAQ